MNSSVIAFGAGLLCAGLAMAVIVLRRGRSVAAWSFVAGMLVLGTDSALGGLSLSEADPERLRHWHTLALIAKSFVPSLWLTFSLTYSRGDAWDSLERWWPVIGAFFLIPVGVAVGFREEMIQAISRVDSDAGWWIHYGKSAKALNLVVLIGTIAVLANVERTFRAAVGTMQWRIKFVVLGLAIMFGARIYTRSQALLFSGYDLNLTIVETGALIIGSLLMVIAYLRHGFAEVDIYPSRAVIQGSVTVLLVGGYLALVGVLAEMAAYFGGTENFQLQALVVLAGVAMLAILLLSDRLRQRLRAFVSRHFNRPEHDSRAIWTLFTRRLSRRLDPESYGAEVVKLLAETFNVLSVTMWVFDEQRGCFTFAASTADGPDATDDPIPRHASIGAVLTGLQNVGGPFDLDRCGEPWAENLRHLSLSHFSRGGNRICLPFLMGTRSLGVAILADRVDAVPYSEEDLELLRCIGDQVAAGLLQFRLTEELMQGRELEAFRAMSTFFVHDLKNAASSLSLMLENLPEHFDDPSFREDALRGIASTVSRINQIIGRLGTLQRTLELTTTEVDLNEVVSASIDRLGRFGDVELVQELEPGSPIRADREQLETVITNLLLNAREAVGRDGRVTVSTAQRDGRAILTVADTGCGMTPAFVRDSLFRPFQTTKKKGLGIGMFQSRMIVEAHRASLQVESEPGRGTTFRILLPLNPEAP